jgi:hypothetical protein
MTKPLRQRRGDRLTSHKATSEEVQADYATGPFDAAARRMDLKWGVSRLPDLVSPETAARFGAAIAKLNAAIDAADPDLVIAKVKVCIKGFEFMDAEATASGAQPADPEVMEYDLDGFRFGILRDAAAWMAAQEARPDLRLYTLAEVATALKGVTGPIVDAVRDAFPGARITSVKSKPPVNYDLGGDSIPF